MSYEKAQETAEFIRSKYDKEIKTAVVLGSGLGGFADELENAVKIPYEEVPHFKKSTVEGHAGQLVLGEVNGVSIAVQQGRFHFYEGYRMSKVIFPVRVFGVLGVFGSQPATSTATAAAVIQAQAVFAGCMADGNPVGGMPTRG